MAYYDNFNSGNTYYFKGDENSTIFRPINGLYADPKKGFSTQLYNYYMAKHEFAKAADYAMMFHSKNAKKDLERISIFRRMKEEADLRSSLYGRLQPEEADELDFYDAYLRGDTNFLDSNSPTLKRFNYLKRQFVYGANDDGTKEVPSKISVDFAPDNGRFLWFNVKNDNGYKNFLERTGYNTAYLEGKGVLVKEDKGTGKYTIEFDYDSPISNELIYNLSRHANDQAPGDKEITIKGLDRNGKLLGRNLNINEVNPNTVINPPLPGMAHPLGARGAYLDQFSEFIDRLKSKKEDVYNNSLNKTFSSTVFGGPTDEIVQLKNALDNIDPHDSELRTYITTQINQKEEHLFNQLGNVVNELGNFEVYSDYKANGEGNLVPLEQSDYSDVKDQILQSINLKDIRISFGESGGKFGTFITVPRVKYDSKTGRYLNHPTYQLFIAGLWDDQAKDMAVHNTKYRALTKMDEIAGLDYEFNLSDGRHIGAERSPKGNNGDYDYTFYLRSDGSNKHEYLSREEILNILDMYYMGNDIDDDLYVNFRNNEGNLVHSKEIDDYLKERIIWYINGLYPDVKELTINNIWGIGDDRLIPNKENYRLKEKIDAVLYMYKRAMNNIDRFK